MPGDGRREIWAVAVGDRVRAGRGRRDVRLDRGVHLVVRDGLGLGALADGGEFSHAASLENRVVGEYQGKSQAQRRKCGLSN